MLLEHIQTNWAELKDKVTKKKNVWSKIATALQDVKPGVNSALCDQKWRNLTQKVKQYTDNQSTTGKGKMNKPEFLDDVLAILGGSHVIKPPNVIDSLQKTQSGSTESAASCTPTSLSAGSMCDLDVGNPIDFDTETPRGVKRKNDMELCKSKCKKMKPNTTRERLESKIDRLIESQEKVQQKHEEQFDGMLALWKDQHKERIDVMKSLISVLKGDGKSKKSKRDHGQTSRDSDSD